MNNYEQILERRTEGTKTLITITDKLVLGALLFCRCKKEPNSIALIMT